MWVLASLILSHFSKISHENEIIWSLLQNSFIVIGYLKTAGREGGGGGSSKTPEPPLVLQLFCSVVFVSENLVCSCGDIMTFKSLQLAPI